MRRVLITVVLTLSLSLVNIATASAQYSGPLSDVCDGEASTSEVCAQQHNTENPIAGKGGVLVTVLNILSFVVGVASVLMVILGGLKYVTSSGDSNAVSNAKNTVLYAIIGLVVFLFSQVIIRFVISKL